MRPPYKRSFRVDLTDLVRPQEHCAHYACQLEAYRWMAWTGEAFRGSYGHQGMYEALSESSCIGLQEVEPLRTLWLRAIRAGFARAILGWEGRAVHDWRKRRGVAVYRSITVPFPATAAMSRNDLDSDETWECRRALNRIFQTKGTLRAGHNQYHPKARWIDHCLMRLRARTRSGPPLWLVQVYYGYRNDGGWLLDVCHQERWEPLPWFLKRAEAALNGLVKREGAGAK